MDEESDYQILQTFDNVEIRSYNEMIYASYTPSELEGRDGSFRYVANYIFGENNKNEKISMTSPVVVKPYNNYEMAFIMPKAYSLNTLPTPNDDKIQIYKVPSSIKAAIRYSGYTSESIEIKKKQQLIEVLDKYNIFYENDFEVFIYNSPFKIFNRRNEIVVSVHLENKKKINMNQKVYLGGGCFWCVEAVFDHVIGVKNVVSGYSGGSMKNPTYKDVSSGNTKHAEVCEISYNPDEISFEDLLKIFFYTHDPTTLNRQGNDEGEHYRSIILFSDEDQEKVAKDVIQELNASVFDQKIVTELVPFETFYIAETSHQDYYANNKYAPYCSFVISPKVDKLKKELRHFYK